MKSTIYTNSTGALSFMGEIVLSFLAVLLTIADLLIRASLFSLRQMLQFLFLVCFTLFLMSFFLLAYLLVMGFSLALGPGLNTHLS